MNLARVIDNFHARHPRIAIFLAILIVAICMSIARQWDRAETEAVRVAYRGQT